MWALLSARARRRTCHARKWCLSHIGTRVNCIPSLQKVGHGRTSIRISQFYGFDLSLQNGRAQHDNFWLKIKSLNAFTLSLSPPCTAVASDWSARDSASDNASNCSVFRMSFALCSRPWQVIERRTPLYHELDGLGSNPITCTFFLTLFQFVIEKLSTNANNKQQTNTLFESRGSRSPFQVFQHWSIQLFAILLVIQGRKSFVNQFM